MGLRANPTQRQLRLGLELRRLRDATGLTAAEAGGFAGLSGAHLGHMESGRTAIPLPKLRVLLDVYGIESEPYIEALVAMGQATGRGWWADYKRDVTRSALDLAELESMSVSQGVFDMVYLPGLLQTPEYMHALLKSANPDSPRVVERFQEFRLRRQKILSGESAPSYHAIIYEAAFHMDFVEPKAMRGQLTYLMEVARMPHVTIQILPFKSGGFPAVGTPFTIFGASTPELSTVYLEHDAGSVFFGDSEHLRRYSLIFEQLAAIALPPLDKESERVFVAKKDSFSLLQHLVYLL